METKIVCHFYLINGGEQVISMSIDAFDAMHSNIDKHLRDIAHDLRANKYQYYINKD